MKSHRHLFTFLAGFCFLLAPTMAWTKVEYDSNQLMMMNADQISDLVRKKIKRAQDIQSKQEESSDGTFLAESEAVEQLKDAMRIVLARVDQDGTRANAFSRLRRELVDLNSLEVALQDIAKEGITALKNEDTPPRRASTYIVLLENLMAEVRPEAKGNNAFKKIIEDIRDANIKLPDKLKNQTFMRSMAKPISPSETAAKIYPQGTPTPKKK